ncbi:MAG: dihydrofolate reductase [Bacteroidaceae bacterium]|nr:dihydrofolate reductase [Bacteroidaceae bacterium]
MTEERFADLQLLRYDVPGFHLLPLRQKLLVYYLAEAALLGRDILWDQNCRYGLRLRQVLEAIYINYNGKKDDANWQAFVVYLKRVWFSNGIHHHYSYQKFEPGFSREFFLREASRLDASLLPLSKEELAEIIFNPDVMPKRVNQADGEDLLLTSSCNYYAEGITQAEAEAFYANLKRDADAKRPPMLGLNSRLERKADGTLYENIWRSGGLYGKAIDRICEMLVKARYYAENDKQREVIDKLVEFYRTGNLKAFDDYAILWVEDTEGEIDFTNGFTEVYGDPLGLKASWEGYVNIIDHEATSRAKALSDNAQWFENNSPVDARFKKKECRGISAKVISAAMLGGDLYPSSAIGINLPNSDWIRAEYGSKSVTIANLTHAYNIAAKGSGMREEFVIDEETRQLLNKYGDVLDDLHTDLHECLGHGSGQLLPGVDADALRAYGSTIEEARADLFGLYYIADKKLVELGLTPNEEAYKSQYYSYLLNGLLTQMVRIEEGRQIEEAHMRNRAIISRWTLDNYPEAVQIVEKKGKHYVRVTNYEMLREAFGELLAEVQRIKSEGDYEAARKLVEQYGIRLDPELHHEICERYQRLNLAPYKGFINPKYELVQDEAGNILDVSVSFDEAYDRQMLRYSQDYKTL